MYSANNSNDWKLRDSFEQFLKKSVYDKIQ